MSDGVKARDWSRKPAGDDIERAIDIELFGTEPAKHRGKDGRRVHGRRYSRSIGAAFYAARFAPGDCFELTFRADDMYVQQRPHSSAGSATGGRGTWTCSIWGADDEDGSEYECRGEVTSDENAYCPEALAVCRAILHLRVEEKESET